MIVESMPLVIKRRPGPHKLEGITTKQHPGFVLAKFPRDYPITAPQRKVRDAAKTCGIKKGMSRGDLVNKMRTCIPDQF
jgi:hypothetical protein